MVRGKTLDRRLPPPQPRCRRDVSQTQVLSSAASSWVKGGTRRVLTVPAIDRPLAMIATAAASSGKAALSSGAEPRRC